MTANKLPEPCPFCGSVNIQQKEEGGSNENTGYNVRSVVSCRRCGAQVAEVTASDKQGWCTESTDSVRARAVAKWNRREALRSAAGGWRPIAEVRETEGRVQCIWLGCSMFDFIGRTLYVPKDGGPMNDGMLPDELVPHAKGWYQLCEVAPHRERCVISGELADAIIATICRLNGEPPTIPPDAGEDTP